MPLSLSAEAKIRNLVEVMPDFSAHALESQHFDHDTAYNLVYQYSKGREGLGSCGFFVFDGDTEPEMHRTDESKIVDPGEFIKQDPDGFTLTGKPLTQASNAHKEAVKKFKYRLTKDARRRAVETRLKNSWNANKEIDKKALILAFLLSKKATLHSENGPNGTIAIEGPIPSGFAGYIIPAGAPKYFDSYDYTESMRVVLGGGDGNPFIITAYPIRD